MLCAERSGRPGSRGVVGVPAGPDPCLQQFAGLWLNTAQETLLGVIEQRLHINHSRFQGTRSVGAALTSIRTFYEVRSLDMTR